MVKRFDLKCLILEKLTLKLYLVRHGDAVGIGENIRRPLSEQGLKEVKKMGQFLADHTPPIKQIYHSEKLRAEQTAEEIAQYLTPPPKLNVLEGLLPDDNVEPLVVYSNQWEEDTLLVGHLPYLANFASLLLMSQGACFDFKTAAALCLEKVAPSQWCIAWFVNPQLLP